MLVGIFFEGLRWDGFSQRNCCQSGQWQTRREHSDTKDLKELSGPAHLSEARDFFLCSTKLCLTYLPPSNFLSHSLPALPFFFFFGKLFQGTALSPVPVSFHVPVTRTLSSLLPSVL